MFDLPTTSIALVFVGGFAVSTAHAALRREPFWALAFALPLLLCAERAGLPLALVAWGCVAYLLAVSDHICSARWRGWADRAWRSPMLGAIAALGLMSGDANARYLDLGATSLHHPPVSRPPHRGAAAHGRRRLTRARD